MKSQGQNKQKNELEERFTSYTIYSEKTLRREAVLHYHRGRATKKIRENKGTREARRIPGIQGDSHQGRRTGQPGAGKEFFKKIRLME